MESVPFVSVEYPVANPPDAIVEPARIRDVRSVAAIQRMSFPPRLAYGSTALLTLMVWPNVTFLVARDRASDRILGCGIADCFKGSTRVMNLAIDPAARRQRVGRQILRALGESMPDGDMTLMVQEHNAGAQALYLGEGYLRAGFARDYYGSGQHGIMMRKPRYSPRLPRTISV